MEERIEEKIVPSHKVSKVIYIAKDGKEFPTKSYCQDHEDSLSLKELDCKDLDLCPFVNTFYHVDSEETFKLLLRTAFGFEERTVLGKKIVIGDWVASNYDYNPNGKDDYHLVTLEELKNAIKRK